jgi:aminobenzoyl-glutamate utilization protein B
MTETTLELKAIGGDANIVPNDALAKVAQRNLEEVGGFRYTVDEEKFAEDLQKSLPLGAAGKLDSTVLIVPCARQIPTRPPPRLTWEMLVGMSQQ